MAFSCGKNWRFNYIVVDQSVVVNDTESTVIGWIAARAPKGTRRGIYFSKGNGELIDAIMGAGSADWPDLIEAKAFNTEYPLYIVAPPGSSSAYPSYVGGKYVTTKGLMNFYCLESVEDLRENSGNAWVTKVVPSLENKFDKNLSLSKIEIGLPGYSYEPSDKELGAGYFKIVDTSIDSGESYIKFTKPASLDVDHIDYDAMKNGLVASTGTDVTYWGDDESIWVIEGNVAKLPNFGFEDSSNPLEDWIGSEAIEAVNGDGTALAKLLLEGAVNGASIAFPITGLFSYAVNIADITYCAIAQYCPSEIPTTVQITDFGYDKYQYDCMVTYGNYTKTEIEGLDEDAFVIDVSGTSLDTNTVMAEAPEYMLFTKNSKPAFIGVKQELVDASGTKQLYYIKSDDLNTQTIVPHSSITGIKNSELYHKFFRVDGDSSFTNLATEEELIELYGETKGLEAYNTAIGNDAAAAKASNYNKFTFSASEEVKGVTISGGEFTGSLDEDGTDIYGNLDYWPLIIAEDDATFCKVIPSKAIGDIIGDSDSNGFYKGARILDPFDVDGDGVAVSKKTMTLVGDRYATLVMRMNRNSGEKGGAWRPQWEGIIREALEEATAPYYDDAYIFMEPTGQEKFKNYIKNINTAQEMAITVSPKLLTYDSKKRVTSDIAKKVVVNGRVGTGSCGVQYAGAFYAKDDVTNATYIRYPIGAVGLALARSAEFQYGGKAIMQLSGGILDGDVTSAVYSIDDDADKILTEKGINPIILRNGQMMVTSDRTTKNPIEYSDWSEVAHAHSFLIVKREIRDNVMAKQLGLPITKAWVNQRTSEVNLILAKRLGDNGIWTSATCDCSKSLQPVNKAKRNFVIEVGIRVAPISQTITLVITNLAQQ